MNTSSALILAAFALFSGGNAPDLIPKDPLELSPEMQAFLEAKIDRNAPEMQRLEELVSRVFQDKALGFTYTAETRSAAETFRRRNGNCLSFTLMFLAMARHLDLDVRFREVEVVPTWDQKGRVFVVSRHVNVSARIGGMVYVVDLFPRVDRFEIGGIEVSDKRGLAHYYNNIGADYLAHGDPDTGLLHFSRALELDREAAFVWANKGVAHTHLRQFEEAEEAYFTALNLDRHEMVAMSNLAELYERIGQPRKARRYARQVEKFRDKNPYYHFNLGQLAYRERRYEESIRYYKAALKRKDTDHRFYWALACAKAQLGATDEVEKYLKKAAELAPDENGKNRYHQKLEQLAANIPVPPDLEAP